MKRRKILIECIPDIDVNGIFRALYDLYGEELDWLNDYEYLDLNYFGNISGKKSVAPIIETFLELDETEILDVGRVHRLAHIIYGLYHEKWNHYYALLQAQYNPIENYSMLEQETPNLKHTEKVSDDYEVTDTRKVSTDLTTYTDTATTGSGYGFNSDASVDLNDNSGSQRTNVSGDGNSNIEENTHSQTGSIESTETGNRTLTRSGNIGVTTTQQMMTQELEFWKWTFYDSVFKDVDSVLTIPLYDY